MNKIISAGTSSAFLYIYEYLVLLTIFMALMFWIKILAGIPIVLMIVLFWDAKTMHHELTDKTLYISASFLDEESITVKLEDVKGFYIVDRQPWKFFSLGTVLVVIDTESEWHPCIKCIKNPLQLAKTIKRYAVKNNAYIEPDIDLQIITSL